MDILLSYGNVKSMSYEELNFRTCLYLETRFLLRFMLPLIVIWNDES